MRALIATTVSLALGLTVETTTGEEAAVQ